MRRELDLNIVLDAGKTLQAALPVTGRVREVYTAMLAAGQGEMDTSAVATVLQALAHV